MSTSTTLVWRTRAGCRGADPDLFFPGESSRDYAVRVQQAKAYCVSCAVWQQCLGYALDHGIRDGIWGGLTGAERAIMGTGVTGRTGSAPVPGLAKGVRDEPES